ncbi:hypothetical protein ACSBR1_017663 [Camellia fascicularis]
MTALVTGSTCGIRHAIVEKLAGLEAKVHTCARNETKLKRCLRDWEDERFGVTGSVCDVSSCPQQEELMDSVSSIFNGKLNILVARGVVMRAYGLEFAGALILSCAYTLFFFFFGYISHQTNMTHTWILMVFEIFDGFGKYVFDVNSL